MVVWRCVGVGVRVGVRVGVGVRVRVRVAPSLPHAAEKPERVERMLGGKVSAGSMKVVLVGSGVWG